MDRNSGVDAGLAILLEKAVGQELDYGFVMGCLKSYKNPRLKLTHLLKIKALVRVKKGIYVFGEKISKNPYSPEILANMIYGPSYVSLEWACQYYRLIPERVTTVTSVTTQRTKQFHTPLGLFSYDHMTLPSFAVGTTLMHFSNNRTALVATKEKALVDLLILRRGGFKSMKHFKETLLEDLRIEEEDLVGLNLPLLSEIYKAKPHSAIKYLIDYRKQYA